MASDPTELSSVRRAMIEAAVAAPSPDNNQPWLFRAVDDSLLVYLDRERSLPSDEASIFDMTAIGAAVENAVIAASQFGQTAEVIWRGLADQDQGHRDPVVEIKLRTGGAADPLFTGIPKRCTCRKAYDHEPLGSETLGQMADAVANFGEVQVDWITNKKQKATFGKLIAATDSMRFRTKPFHEELFRQLRFSRQEVESSQDGLDVRTLELPLGVSTMLRLLGNWKLMRLVHACHLTPLLTAPSKVSVIKSGAIAVVSVPIESAEMFLTGGRAIERLWLQAAELNLAMHPLGSLSIFLLQSQPRPEFQKLIESVRREVSSLLPSLDGRTIQLAFRLGRSQPPTQRSLRRPAEQMILPD